MAAMRGLVDGNWVCFECGCIVHDLYVKVHDEFHDQLNPLLNEGSSGAALPRDSDETD